MKYTIEGFSQEVALKMGLDIKDLVFLRWMVDFYNTGRMEIHHCEGKEFFWLSYQHLIKELPILGIESKDVLARRLRGMSAVLESKILPGVGNQNYYRFKQDALFELLSNSKEGLPDRFKGGPDQKVGYYPTQKSGASDPKVGCNNIHLQDPSTKDSKHSGGKEAFVKPTIEQIRDYCRERNYQIDPEAIFDYYESNGWKVGKTKMQDWKAAVRNWWRRSKEKGQPSGGNGKAVNWDPIISDSLGKIATDAMIKALLRKMPENLWWKVENFLRKRYPLGHGAAFLRVETELIREMKSQ